MRRFVDHSSWRWQLVIDALLVTHWEHFAELKPTGCVGDGRAVTNGTGYPISSGIPFFRVWVRPNVATAGHGTSHCFPENSDRAYAGLSWERRGVKRGGSGVTSAKPPNGDDAAGLQPRGSSEHC